MSKPNTQLPIPGTPDNQSMVASLLEEIRRAEGNDPSFVIGYLSGLLTLAADRSPDVRDWLKGYVDHLVFQPSLNP